MPAQRRPLVQRHPGRDELHLARAPFGLHLQPAPGAACVSQPPATHASRTSQATCSFQAAPPRAEGLLSFGAEATGLDGLAGWAARLVIVRSLSIHIGRDGGVSRQLTGKLSRKWQSWHEVQLNDGFHPNPSFSARFCQLCHRQLASCANGPVFPSRANRGYCPPPVARCKLPAACRPLRAAPHAASQRASHAAEKPSRQGRALHSNPNAYKAPPYPPECPTNRGTPC